MLASLASGLVMHYVWATAQLAAQASHGPNIMKVITKFLVVWWLFGGLLFTNHHLATGPTGGTWARCTSTTNKMAW